MIKEGSDEKFPSQSACSFKLKPRSQSSTVGCKGKFFKRGGKKNQSLDSEMYKPEFTKELGILARSCCPQLWSAPRTHRLLLAARPALPLSSAQLHLHNILQLVLSQPFYSLESAIASINLFNLFLLAPKPNRPSDEFAPRWITTRFLSASRPLPCQARLPAGQGDGSPATGLGSNWWQSIILRVLSPANAGCQQLMSGESEPTLIWNSGLRSQVPAALAGIWG